MASISACNTKHERDICEDPSSELTSSAVNPSDDVSDTGCSKVVEASDDKTSASEQSVEKIDSEASVNASVDAEVHQEAGHAVKTDSVDEPVTPVDAEGAADVASDAKDKAIDPYAYLARDEFTTEIYKVEISGLPKYFGIHQLKKKLCAVGLKPGKIKAMQNGKFAFVNFKCEEDREQAMEVVQGHEWKGNKMKIKKANPSADPLLKKRKQDADAKASCPAKKAKEDAENNLPVEERLHKAVTPLWNVSYEKQLETKQGEVAAFIKRFGKEMFRNNDDRDMRRWQAEQERTHDGLCCLLHPIKPSPVIDGYRNKCEFTIGQDVTGKDNTVGFRLGSYRGGTVSVVEPTSCLHIPQVAKEVVKSLQTYLQSESQYAAFNPEDRSGHWRTAVVRNNRDNQVMLVTVFHPQKLSEDEIEEVKAGVKAYFEDGKGKDVNLSSLYFLRQTDRNDCNDGFDYEHLLGLEYLQTTLLDLTFRISPGAFFQVNTLAAEVLYSAVADYCTITPETILLDICCGTGTIGLTMAKRVKRVVGIELCKEAVEDAKVNAALNGVTNVEYHCGKAEDVLPGLIKRFWRQQVVAVVDPPRAGLHADVIRAIRKSTFVRHLVYVSCKPTGALQNLVDLTRMESRRVKGPAFRLLEALPVDLFPYINHSELVLLFDRPTPSTD